MSIDLLTRIRFCIVWDQSQRPTTTTTIYNNFSEEKHKYSCQKISSLKLKLKQNKYLSKYLCTNTKNPKALLPEAKTTYCDVLWFLLRPDNSCPVPHALEMEEASAEAEAEAEAEASSVTDEEQTSDETLELEQDLETE